LRSPEQKKLCRNYVKELTLNPSLGKRGTFPLLFAREGGKGDELFNLFITTQPQNEKGIKKTTKPSIFFIFSIFVQFFNTTPLQN
jgi:hypothetical protein